MSDRLPVILLGFDAAERELIEKLMADGRMPNLQRLRERGRWGNIQTQPKEFLSLVWSTFFCSARLGDHGWYFNKLWNPERQQIQYLDNRWLPVHPFWEYLDDQYRVALLDIPFAAVPASGAEQAMLNGWQCHDDFGRIEYPKGEWARAVTRHGHPKMQREVFGPQDARTMEGQLKEVLDTNEQFGDLVCGYLERNRWDLLVAVFGAVHRGTHYLWDLNQIDTRGLDDQTLFRLRGARDNCYTSFDVQLGRIIEAAPEDARILAFALHGMGPNDGWYEVLPRIVERIEGGMVNESKPRKGLVYRTKKALPWRIVRQVTRRIPHAWNKALVPLWSRRMYDWSRTRFFILPMDYNGYVRINLRGRERDGCVDPADYDRTIDEIDFALRSFRDIETGRPIIQGTLKVDSLVGPDAPRRLILPDLVVLWEPPHAVAESSGVVSETYGEIRWPKGRKLPSGRSGNHTPHGWFAAAGPGIDPGNSCDTCDSADLIPTVFRWLNAPLPEVFAGRPIEELLARFPQDAASKRPT